MSRKTSRNHSRINLLRLLAGLLAVVLSVPALAQSVPFPTYAPRREHEREHRPTQRADEDALTQEIIALASQYGRYGYRRITALLVRAGWQVGKDRVERIWRREGLKVPQKRKTQRPAMAQ